MKTKLKLMPPSREHATDEAPQAQPWSEIDPFHAVDLPEFPTHALPDRLRRWVEEESHATQTPADLAGLLALAVCSASIARRVEVEPRPDWTEPVNLFVAVLLEPGNRKSAVFKDATAPLREFEADQNEILRPIVARERSERRQMERQLREMEKLAASGDETAWHYAMYLAEVLAEQPEPALLRLIVEDATAESLRVILAEQGGRIASMSAEGGVFDALAGAKSGSRLEVYLKGHAGDEFNEDRISRQAIHVERPAITCAYTLQPIILEKLAKNEVLRGRGLPARFLYAQPRSWIGKRDINPSPVSENTRMAYRKVVRGLAIRGLAHAEETIVLQLSPDATALLMDWEGEIEAMLAEGGRMAKMCDWGAKLPGATLRLAAVLHCAEHGVLGRIGNTTLEAAIEIARYLIPHAEAVLSKMVASESIDESDAQRVLRWIKEKDRREFTKSEAQHQLKSRFPKAQDIDPALSELVRRGYIRRRPQVTRPGPGQHPSPTFDVNPEVFETGESTKHSQNSQKGASEPRGGDSGNSGNDQKLIVGPQVRITAQGGR